MVRRLAGDLPLFDSVWIDALVQARHLTPFQATFLERDQPDALWAGPCLLLDRLGHRSTSRTFLARLRSGSERHVLKMVEQPPEELRETARRLETLYQNVQGLDHPSICSLHACHQDEHGLVVISQYVHGPHLRELLIRRGRFSAEIVEAIANQLIDGLAAFEERGCVHGAICLTNVILTQKGTVCLVEAGLGSAVAPVLIARPSDSPDRYNGIAPELIGTGQSADSVSDIYAVGCLLWQLLTGRPPFPTGDPLSRLASHQMKRIDDVRKWAPDTPDHLAETIRRFTQHRREDRPGSFRELAAERGKPTRRTRNRLRRFRTLFESSVSPVAPHRRSRLAQTATVATLTLLLAATSVGLLHQGAKTELLRLTSQFSQYVPGTQGERRPAGEDADTVRLGWRPDSATGLPLPEPDENGVIVLTQQGPYRGDNLAVVGSLTIQSAPEQGAEIVLDHRWEISAEELSLKNLRIRWDTRQESAPRALLLVQSQSLQIDGCRFEAPAATPTATDGPPTASALPIIFGWRPIDANDHSGGTVTIEKSLFLGDAIACYLAHPPQQFSCDNSLKVGAGTLMQWAHWPDAGRDPIVRLDRVTLRNSGPVIGFPLSKQNSGLGFTTVEANRSVFDITDAAGAMIEVLSQTPLTALPEILQLTGETCLIRTGTQVAVNQVFPQGARQTLATKAIHVDGVMATSFEFAASASKRPADSRLTNYDGPRFSPQLPGIAVESLPAWLQSSPKDGGL